MRHANISMTMNIYTKALTPAKREAQSQVIDVLLDRSRKSAENAGEGAASEPTLVFKAYRLFSCEPAKLLV
jgi:hypothetical protein